MSAERYFNTFNYKEDRSDTSNLYKNEVDQIKEDKKEVVSSEPTSDVDMGYTVEGQGTLARCCPACKVTKPNTLEYFYPSKRSVSGISVKCRPCCDEASIKWNNRSKKKTV